MPNLKPAIFILFFFLSICLEAQINSYQHPPVIMGQKTIEISGDSSFVLHPGLLVIHDVDEADFSTYDISVSGGSNYSLSESTIKPNEGFIGNLYVNVRVSDGTYESNVFQLIIGVEPMKNRIDHRLLGQDSVRILKNSHFKLKPDRFIFRKVPSVEHAAFYVSPSGNDNGDGTIDDPLKTFNGARLKVREFKNSNGLPPNGITVFFREGDYYINSTVGFDGDDSGAKDQMITYRSYPFERVRFTGSKKVEWNWFSDAPSSITNKIKDSNARSKIKMIDLKARGINQYGDIVHVGYVVSNQGLSPCNIFIDGKAMHLCRYPNTDNFNDVKTSTGKKQFTSKSNIVSTWENTGDLWIDGALSKPWEWKKNKIKSISSSGVVEMEWDYHNDITVQYPKMFYFNMIEELDYPGEYFLDRTSGVLYFYPPEGTSDASEIRVSQSTSEIMELNGTRYLSFIDLVFEGTRNTAIDLKNNASYNQFINCEVYACGLDGIRISGYGNKVMHSHIHNIGANGIYLNGGSESALTPALNLVENCKVNDFSQERKVYNPGLTLFGIGQIVRHMELNNGPHMAIKVKGNNHIIEYCDLHHAPKEYSDMLAVYFNTGNFPLMRGTIIRKNKFHDVNGTWKQSPGVYMDNETCGVLVEENYFYNNIAESNGWSVMVHGGSDNIVRKNVFVHCSFPFNISHRLNGYAAGEFEGRLDRWENEFKNKATEVYFKMYPELNHFFDDEGVTPDPQTDTFDKKKNSQGIITNYWDRRTPSTNVFKDNLVYNESPAVFAMPSGNRGFYSVSNFRVKNGITQENLISSNNININYDPGFSDYSNRDLSVLENKLNPGLKTALPHLASMPFHEMGLYEAVGVQHNDFIIDENDVMVEIVDGDYTNFRIENGEIIPHNDYTGYLTIPVKLKIGDDWESEIFDFKINVVDEFANDSKSMCKNLSSIQLYPNPVLETLSIKGMQDNAVVEILSMDGAMIIQSEQANLDVSLLTPGMYIVRIDQQQQIILKRFVKI